MKFTHFLYLVLVLVFGLFLIVALDDNFEFPNTPEETADQDRISDLYLDGVVYGEENETDASANRVTSIVVDFRSFDTLGEVTVLFLSSLGVALLLGGIKKNRLVLDFKQNFVLKVGARVIVAVMLLTGFNIIIHGHLTPGGGFPGGAMIASSLLLLYLSDETFRARIKGFKVLESTSGMLYIVIGLLGLTILGSGVFLDNFLSQGVVGDVFSAGIIPIVYVLIGLKVGSEITGVIDEFLTEEVI